MVGTENTHFKVGGVQSPLVASLTNSSLQDLDPSLYQILGYFASIIQLHCGARWDLECGACGKTDLQGLIVNQALPYDPLPLATENQFRFPLLCAYETASSYDFKTRAYYHITRDMEVLYILPPLQSEQQERLIPFLAHIERTLVDRLVMGKDDQYENGAAVWSLAGLEEIQINTSTFGKVPGLQSGLQSNIFLPCISIQLKVIERRNEISNDFENYDGLDGYVDLSTNADQQNYPPIDTVIIDDFVDIKT